MKNVLSWMLLAFITVSFLQNCLGNKVNREIRAQSGFIGRLRNLYSSGDPSGWPKPLLDAGAEPYFSEIGHLPEVKFPADNPYSEEKAFLGKTLFYDPRLSASDQIACASCHDPELAWGDGRTFSFGHNRRLGTRNAMTILNSAYAGTLFWDGRAASLEDQSQMPIQDTREMNGHIDLAAGKIAKIKGYEILFQKAFGSTAVTKDKISKALAVFERTVVSPPSRFDRFIDGETGAFTDDEVMGLHLFRTKAQCISCHNSGYFSNNRFENIGTSLLGSKDEDLGRFLVTGKPEDAGKFRVPSLREVSRTGPWMHNGSFTNLADIIRFYNKANPESPHHPSTVYKGMVLNSEKSEIVRLLELSDTEIAQLEAFLETLNTKNQRITPPVLPE